MEGVVRAWLAQQCEMIPGVARGIVLLRPTEGGFPVQAARWPESEREAPDLAATARSAVAQRQVVINGANGHGLTNELRRPIEGHDFVAHGSACEAR